MIRKVFFWAGLASIAVTAMGRERGFRQYHNDFRTTVKFQTVHSQDNALVSADAKGETKARAYLTTHGEEFGLDADLSNLVLDKISHSLLGSHYHFRQLYNGIAVEKAEIVVSIAYEKGRIYKVYNNTFPVQEQTLVPAVILDRDDALDMAWLDLRVHGELITKPQVRLVYLPHKNGFRLVYITDLSVAAPYGFWETTVDAISGEVLQVRSTDISRKLKPDTRVPYDGPIFDRHEAFQRFYERKTARLLQKAGIRAMGSGMSFDPDPRTTLLNADLQDGSPAGDFDGSYFLIDLLDITDDAGTFRLTGPWVDIIDFEAPSTPPSTTGDGNWTQLRGDNAFNDVMTYYHLDKNQRYMQSLGFTGATGIQELSIEVDTDGFNGADNSHFIPASNRLGFGHGCVDDNEDADVILHEYGHAINFSINDNWSGGDTGAMGEGFGDYWAGSYSISTPNGQTFHPEWVYSWDGHGTGNQCWPGRLLNRTDAMYDPALTYTAHQTVGNFISDELWSAPLFKSLQDLILMGETREDADQIILEAQFGLGGGLTMRDMALSIIETALDLFPGGPHGQVFIDNFDAQNFIDDPGLTFIEATLNDTVANCDDDGFLDVGETGLLTVTLKNDSFTALSDTTATITSSADVFIDNGGVINFPASNFPDETLGTLEVTLNSAVARTVDLDFSITFTDSNPSISPAMADVTLLANVDETPNQLVTDDVEHGPNVWLTDLADGTASWSVVEDGVFVSASHSWHVPDTASVLDSSLVTPLIDVNAAGDFTFSFNHRHRFEDGSWDGGVLEISTDGTNWTDIGASATPGYNGTITENEASPISLRPAFVNDSPDYPNFTAVNVNLGTAWQGQTVQIRFRIGCDGSAGEEGWYLDNISFPTLDVPLFLERSSEPDVCTLCFGTPQEALDAMLASMGNGDWPENRNVLHYVDFLNNVCVD